MGKIKKLGDMGVRITCSCGNMHEIEQQEDGTIQYDEIHVPKKDEPKDEPTPPATPPVTVAPPKEKYRYTGLFKRERI